MAKGQTAWQRDRRHGKGADGMAKGQTDGMANGQTDGMVKGQAAWQRDMQTAWQTRVPLSTHPATLIRRTDCQNGGPGRWVDTPP